VDGARNQFLPGTGGSSSGRLQATPRSTWPQLSDQLRAAFRLVPELLDEWPDGVHLKYDKMASLLAPYGNAEALAVARDLDSKVERLLRESAE